MKPSSGSLMAYPVPNNSKADGVTKREQFAMAAMQGLLASSKSDDYFNPHVAAKSAAEYADALLAELEKSK